jgi:hypothetical protein
LITTNGGNNQKNIGPFAPYGTTLAKSPYLRQTLDALGVVVGRARFMALPPGESVKPHTDNKEHIDKYGFKKVKQNADRAAAPVLVAVPHP